MTMKADLAAFRAQMRATLKQTKKDEVEFLNKRSVQVLIGSKGFPGAVQITKKATKQQIRKDLNKKYHVAGSRGGKSGGDVKLLWILASKALKKQGIGKGMNPVQWRSAVAQMAERIWKARDASRAYLAAGWLAAVRAMGHTRRSDNGRSLRPVGTSKGRIGWGSIATTSKLRFEAYNNAISNGPHDRRGYVESLVKGALQLAIRSQRRDMEQHLKRTIEKTMRKNSDAKMK